MNNVFQTVNRRGKTRKHVNTQRLFFDYLLAHKHVFNTLLQKFQTEEVVRDIQAKRQQLPGYDMSLQIKSSVVVNNNPSLYLEYSKENIRLYHLSIHLCPHCFDNQTNGLLHFKSNKHPKNRTTRKRNHTAQQQSYLLLHVFGRAEDPTIPYFSLGITNMNASKQELRHEASIIVDVFNSYFDPQNSKCIEKNSKQPIHKYTSYIYKQMKNSFQSSRG